MIITDQIGHQLELNGTPKRIISLVPSQTELLYDLGLGEKVIGITKFCIHPEEWFNLKTRVGGTKTLNFDKIDALNPDLIIANKEENTQSEIEFLQKKYVVYTSDISNLYESMEMISSIGEITNTKEKAQNINDKIKTEFEKLTQLKKSLKSVLYLIWQNPFISVGTSTFIHDMITRCGLINILTKDNRYPEISDNEINNLKPDFILLSSEPYPFKEKHRIELEKIFPNSKIVLVDGEYFSWYGSRLMHAPQYFIDLIEKMA